jgi:hypothetical protein
MQGAQLQLIREFGFPVFFLVDKPMSMATFDRLGESAHDHKCDASDAPPGS